MDFDNKEDLRKIQKKGSKIGFYAIAAFIGLGLVSSCFYSVKEQERAVLTKFGQFETVSGPGLHMKLPIIESVIDEPVNIRTISPPAQINTYTVDSQELDALFTVFYRVPSDKVEFVFRNVPDIDQKVLSMAIDRFKVEVGKVNVSTFAEQRGQLRDRIKAVLTADAQALGVDVTDFQIQNVDYSKSFRIAVEQAATAKATVETREQEKRQAEIAAQKAKIEAIGLAYAARERARGEADAAVLEAQAKAQAIKLEGDAQASAIKAQAEALSQNSNLVELRKADRWNGALPSQMLSNVVPFMTVK